ncbi:MAG: DUF255 domain-containing protein [Salinarchaeum sp.]
MSAPIDRNRLPDTASPYLAAHADNPVHWQPWDATARDAAVDRDLPIFLSVGVRCLSLVSGYGGRVL